MKSTQFLIIGWQEVVVFPEWRQIKMKAKMDTGARSSAIHAEEYRVIHLPSTPLKPLNEVLEMKIKAGTSSKQKMLWVRAPIIDYRNVKNSGGKIEERPFIETTIGFGDYSYPIVLSVTNREKMKFPVLLGRAFLAGKFLVDPSSTRTFKSRLKKLEKS